MQTVSLNPETVRETAGYFSVPGAHLYTVLHEVAEPVARVLLVGPFASERHFSYHPWVRWARYLAAKQIEVLRYDYRGVGESTGVFEDMSFKDWDEDVQLLSSWLGQRTPGAPLILHGLEVGAILAAKSFERGAGDGLVLWSPPESAHQALRSSLMRWAGLEQMFESSENRKSIADFIRQLESGSSIEVQGYQWSSDLWRNSFDFVLPANMANEALASETSRRPVRITKLSKKAAPLVKPYLGYDEVKYLGWLYDECFAWIASAFAIPVDGV